MISKQVVFRMRIIRHKHRNFADNAVIMDDVLKSIQDRDRGKHLKEACHKLRQDKQQCYKSGHPWRTAFFLRGGRHYLLHQLNSTN